MKKKYKPWKNRLTKAELKHLKGVHVTTKKAFIKMNDKHNKERRQDQALEPCYWCKGIALKLELEVKAITRPYGSAERNTFTIDKEEMKIMKPVIDIKSNFRRRLFLCITFPPCVVIALVIDAIVGMYKEFNSEMLDAFKHTWKGRQ